MEKKDLKVQEQVKKARALKESKGYQPKQGETDTVLMKVKRAGFSQATGEALEQPVLIRITSRLFKAWLKSHKNLGFLVAEVVYVPDSAVKIIKEMIAKGKKEYSRIDAMKPHGAEEVAMKEERLEGIKSGLDYLSGTFLK